jgi:cytochrome c556
MSFVHERFHPPTKRRISMRTNLVFAVLTLAVSTLGFAQGPMQAAADNKGRSEMGKPMPENLSDQRQVVPLTEPERVLVAAKMRIMLTSVEGIAEGLAHGDTKAVVEAASRSGTHMMKELPAQIRKKFPPPFARLGMATHRLFDQIAHDTKSVKNPAPTLMRLGEAIQRCNACHAAYRFAPPK